MNLSDAGESRIRGYLFLLEQSLRTFLRRDVAADAVREVESHIRERVLDDDGMPNERDALNRLLDAMGPPHRLARAYWRNWPSTKRSRPDTSSRRCARFSRSRSIPPKDSSSPSACCAGI